MLSSPDFFLAVYLLSAWLSLAGCVEISRDKVVVEAQRGGSCSMRCTAPQQPGVQYIAVRWYQVIGDTRYGLLVRNLPNGTTRWYANMTERVQLVGDSFDIFLPSVDCSSSGEYMCHLAAPVGQQNRDGRVQLSVKDCPVSVTEHHRADLLIIVASVVLTLSFLIFFISYNSLRKILIGRKKTSKKELLLKAPLKPLDSKDLMLIYTLGPKTSTTKHLYV